MLKRSFDVLLSLLGLIVLSPLFVLIAILIKLDSKGPVLYGQVRGGKDREPFEMLKFRTMMETKHWLGPVLSAKNDPRVTSLGAILRRTKLNELPQLINVLRGEMSLIGPRPELPYLVDMYEPWQRKRFAVPQGVTGWWQINGRSDKPMHLHTEDDLFYVQNYSLWLDLKILLKTIMVVLRGSGAY